MIPFDVWFGGKIVETIYAGSWAKALQAATEKYGMRCWVTEHFGVEVRSDVKQ